VNFQVTVLKILVSYPDGFAVMSDLKRDMAILATSGRDWAERTKCMGSRVPDLDVFSQGLIERLNGGWRITDKGRAVLEVMQARPQDREQPAETSDAELTESAAQPARHSVVARPLRPDRRPRRPVAWERARTKASSSAGG
jgi:hypothetical protein